ncbi:MAG: glutamine-hydrolyzing GMP synthase subunit GuaA, partial [Thermoplasmata archaeon]
MNDPAAFVRSAEERLRTEVPGRAIIAASGGIDSTVAAILAERSLGERARAIFVDTGLLRAGEVERVAGFFRASGLRHEVVPASDRFFAALAGVVEPEEKRRRIGATFIRLFEEEATRFGTDRLVQGTIA